MNVGRRSARGTKQSRVRWSANFEMRVRVYVCVCAFVECKFPFHVRCACVFVCVLALHAAVRPCITSRLQLWLFIFCLIRQHTALAASSPLQHSSISINQPACLPLLAASVFFHSSGRIAYYFSVEFVSRLRFRELIFVRKWCCARYQRKFVDTLDIFFLESLAFYHLKSLFVVSITVCVRYSRKTSLEYHFYSDFGYISPKFAIVYWCSVVSASAWYQRISVNPGC